MRSSLTFLWKLLLAVHSLRSHNMFKEGVEVDVQNKTALCYVTALQFTKPKDKNEIREKLINLLLVKYIMPNSIGIFEN